MAENRQLALKDWHLFAPHTGAVYEVTLPPQGTNCCVFRLRARNGDFIVKTGDTAEAIAELQREADVLQLLASQVPESVGVVPRFVARSGAYFLYTFLPGENLAVYSDRVLNDAAVSACTARFHASVEGAALCADLVYQFGQLLQTIHTWTSPLLTASIPPNWTQTALQTVIARLESGVWGETLDSPFSPFHGTKTADLLQMAREAIPTISDKITWCHGDWCVPNALVQDGGRVRCAVDWGGGDWADRRYDLATALWSLRRNDLGAFLDDFLRGYNWEGNKDAFALFELIYVIL